MAQSIVGKLNSTDAVIIQHDSYYKDRSHIPEKEREFINYDHPSVFDAELLIEDLAKLKNNLSIKKPIYDFTTHTRRKKTLTIHPAKAIILEGLLTLEHKNLINLMDFKIFLDAAPDIRFIRRLQRDIKERGRPIESVIKQYVETVRPMHLEFVEKSKEYADVIIAGEAMTSKR